MDPVAVIVSALALGASVGLNETAATAVKDAYSGLKRLLVDRYSDVDVSAVERRPDSVPKRDSLREDLSEAGAGADEELLEAATALIALVEAHQPTAASAVGVDLTDLTAAGSIRVHRVDAAGTGVHGRRWQADGDIEIADVQAGPPFRGESTAEQEGPPSRP